MIAFLDESGDLGIPRKSEYFMVIAMMVSEQYTVRAIRLHVKRLIKRNKKPVTELKAWSATQKQRIRLLAGLASEDIKIVSIILDKASIHQSKGKREDWYRRAVSVAVSKCVERWPLLHLTLDKRYTTKSLKDKLEQAIITEIQSLPYQSITMDHEESQGNPCLQAVDYVAWAIKRKYEADDLECYDLIREKIIAELMIEAK